MLNSPLNVLWLTSSPVASSDNPVWGNQLYVVMECRVALVETDILTTVHQPHLFGEAEGWQGSPILHQRDQCRRGPCWRKTHRGHRYPWYRQHSPWYERGRCSRKYCRSSWRHVSLRLGMLWMRGTPTQRYTFHLQGNAGHLGHWRTVPAPDQ